METNTSTKTNAEMVADAPFVLGVLLMRFERDARSLSDYLTLLERQQQLDRIYWAVRSHLMIRYRWSHESATAVANQYRTMLSIRLKEPNRFTPELGPRQPQSSQD